MNHTETIHLEHGYTRNSQHTACGRTFPTRGSGERFALHTDPDKWHSVTQIKANVTCEDCTV